MGNTDQTPFNIDFIQPSQMESSEFHIVFDASENRFHFRGALRSQPLAFLAGEVDSGLSAVFQQAETNL
ncbi:hypothetical protein ADN00_09580, partial [Ornatilinea apprima]